MTPEEKAKAYVDSFRHMIYEQDNRVYFGLEQTIAKEAASFMLQMLLLDLKLDDEQALYFAQVCNEIEKL